VQATSGDGGLARTTPINTPVRIAYDNSTGMVAWTELLAASRVRGVWPNGTITTLFSGMGNNPTGITFAPDGTLYVSDGNR